MLEDLLSQLIKEKGGSASAPPDKGDLKKEINGDNNGNSSVEEITEVKPDDKEKEEPPVDVHNIQEDTDMCPSMSLRIVIQILGPDGENILGE
jgi:hypothetical protein